MNFYRKIINRSFFNGSISNYSSKNVISICYTSLKLNKVSEFHTHTILPDIKTISGKESRNEIEKNEEGISEIDISKIDAKGGVDGTDVPKFNLEKIDIKNFTYEELWKFIVDLKNKKGISYKEIGDAIPGLNYRTVLYHIRKYERETVKGEFKEPKKKEYKNLEFGYESWTAEDDAKLLASYKKYGDFVLVSEFDFPHKRPYLLKNHHERLVSNKGLWSKEEIDRLFKGIELYGNGWQKVAEHVKTRSVLQCKTNYLYLKHGTDLSKKKRWTEKETEKLIELVEKHGTGNWSFLAKELGSAKTYLQLISRYRYIMKDKKNINNWTQKEDDLLLNSINKHGLRNWIKVSKDLEDHKRSPINCYTRWLQINPEFNYGQWEQKEVDLLIEYAKRYKKKWPIISQILVTRTPYACQKKWYEIHLPNLKIGNWDTEEIVKLEELVVKHSKNWAKISLELGTRTPQSCNMRYLKLERAKKKEK
ncbi:hypothetical protein K502DRAFT_341416 [Neoconidiobolus thromboides FSU 785]|nr:hypothetical protein K502DRAFT_341416 [Neoconidiobolus thromboides FSU 785]